MWQNDVECRDDPPNEEWETERVARDEYERHAARHSGHGERSELARVVCAVSEPSPRPYR